MKVATESSTLLPPATVLQQLWQLAGMDSAALRQMHLTGQEPALPSSFAVGTAAQATIAAAALAAAELRHQRGQPRQSVSVDMRHAALECTGFFSLDGVVPNIWDKISGLYPCDGGRAWVRIHANFAHHRDGALRLLGCEPGEASSRQEVTAALDHWNAEAFEQAAADAGLVVAAVRSFEQWDQHPQGLALTSLPLLSIEKIGEAAPLPLPKLGIQHTCLHGVRVLDLTRILAGPVGGRTLAAYGAEVMLVNSPHLPNISSIAETSRGKLSAHIDLHTQAGRDQLRLLVSQSHVYMQGYRPGGLAALGFAPAQVAALRPGIVCVSLSAYGHTGPWAERRGFDSLVQSATGINVAEAQAAGETTPRALPAQILDYASGFLMAYAAQAALLRQQREGGSWLARISLAQTGRWLRSLGRVSDGLQASKPPMHEYLYGTTSGFGQLVALRHAAQLVQTPACWVHPSMPPGSHPPVWPPG